MVIVIEIKQEVRLKCKNQNSCKNNKGKNKKLQKYIDK